MLSFPPNFLWGAATAAHQVEGQNFNNDWWDWEQIPGHIMNGDSSRVACDWWSGRYMEDFDRARELGHNAHRLSVEWSRIEPRPGEWDDAALARYREILTALRERNIEPFITLVHFTQPRWFMESRANQSQGGWLDDHSPEILERLVEHVVPVLGDLCHFWITLNEPNLYILLNYAWKGRPPGTGSVLQALRVARNMMLAHYRAYAAIHRLQPDAQVSLSHQWRWITPANPNSILDRLVARISNYITNGMFMRALLDGVLAFPLGRGEKIGDGKLPLDYFALNYYFENRVTFDLTRPGSLLARQLPSTWLQQTPHESFELAGDPAPNALYSILKLLARSHLPLYITESGSFYVGRDNQSPYLVSHLRALHHAIQEGIDVRGYFWWTLVDNFEWDQGYWLRFGLYDLDVASQARTKRPVADTYACVVRANGLPEELVEKYGRTE
jgi:beta-glucosidase